MKKHILVAIDLSVDSRYLIEKAENLARELDAKLSLFYNGNINNEGEPGFVYDPKYKINSNDLEKANPERHLNALLENTKYPIENTVVGSGDFVKEIESTINNLAISLIICGHHQGLRYHFSSVAKRLLKSTSVDVMVIPLKRAA